jgi:hypothetical protein
MGRQLQCEIRLELASRDLAGWFIQVCPQFSFGLSRSPSGSRFSFPQLPCAVEGSPRVVAAPAIRLNRLSLFAPVFFQLLQPPLSEGHQRVPQRFRHRQVAEPFLVGRHDKPGRLWRATVVEHVLVCRGVVIPVRALLPIGDRELPGFDRIFLPFEESLLLLRFADVQVELEQDGG